MSNLTKRYNDDLLRKLVNYISNGGEESGIPLSEFEKERLDEIRIADEHLRSRKYTKRSNVANVLMEQLKVSRDTAFKLLVMAEEVFESSMPLNKKYTVHRRVEKLIEEIDKCFVSEKYAEAAMLEKTLQKYIEMYPDEIKKHTPKNIQFNILINNNYSSLNVDEAVAEAETIALNLKHG